MNAASGNQDTYPPWSMSVPIAAPLIFSYLLFQYLSPLDPRYEIPYGQFKLLVREGQVEGLQLQGEVTRGKLHVAAAPGPQGKTAQQFSTRLPASGDEQPLPLLERQARNTTSRNTAGRADHDRRL